MARTFGAQTGPTGDGGATQECPKGLKLCPISTNHSSVTSHSNSGLRRGTLQCPDSSQPQSLASPCPSVDPCRLCPGQSALFSSRSLPPIWARAQQQQKDHSRGQGSSTSPLETTSHGHRRPGSRIGHAPGLADLDTTKQAMPSLPASCLLAQTAIACSSVKMKHVPALTDPNLTTFYLAGE